MKRITAVISIIILLLSLASCADGTGGAFAFPLSSSPSTLDPQYTQGVSSGTIVTNCFEGLTRIDSDGNVIPGVAESWSVSADGLVYTFNLRKDSEWCVMRKINGSTIGDWESFDSRVTAYDFAFAFNRAVKADTQCPAYASFMVIKNAEKVYSGELSASSLGVAAVDDFELVITLEHSCPDFLERLATTAFMPCNEEFFNLCAGRYGLNAQYLLCNGPFYVAAWDSATSLTARRNAGYKGEKEVKPVSVTFYFNSDSADIASKVSLGTYSAAIFNDIDVAPTEAVNTEYVDDSVYGFCFNCSDTFFANEYLRLALSFCIDRASLAIPEGSSVSKTCVPSSCTAGGINYYEQVSRQMPTITFNRESALEYWQAGLDELGVRSLSINLLCEEKHAALMREQIQQWQRIFGVNLSVNIVTDTLGNIEKQMRAHDYQLSFAPLHSQSATAANYLAGFMPGRSTNVFAFEDESYSQMIYTALNVSDLQEALNGSFSADSYLIKHAIFYPMFTGQTCFVTHNSVSGITCSTSCDNISFIDAVTTD